MPRRRAHALFVATSGYGVHTAGEGGGGATTVPLAPLVGTATEGDQTLTLAFTLVSNGGSAVTSFTVTATSSDGGTTRTASAAGTPIVVAGLTNGKHYTATVTATNGVGTSAASSSSNTVVPQAPPTVPGAPTIGTATAGNGSIAIAFLAPASNGGSAITSYTVTATSSDGGTPGSASGPSSPITVAGLTNGKTYTATVVATNAAGNSAASSSSNAVIPTASPPTVPGAPTIGTATAGNGSVSVTFAAPGTDGGSTITSYTATAVSSDGGVTQSASGPSSPVTVVGLTNSKTYTATVTATNGVGTGAASGSSNAFAPSAGLNLGPDLAAWMAQPGDQVIVVPGTVANPRSYTVGAITAACRHAATAGTYGGWLILVAEQPYDPATATLTGVTTTVSADTFNKTAHGLTNGSPIYVIGLTNTTGIAINVAYWVVNAAANSFQVAATPGGAAINLTGSNDSGLTLMTSGQGGVTIDLSQQGTYPGTLTGGFGNLSPSTTGSEGIGRGDYRVLFVGFKFINGVIMTPNTQGNRIRFWGCRWDFPTPVWHDQFVAAGGDPNASQLAGTGSASDSAAQNRMKNPYPAFVRCSVQSDNVHAPATYSNDYIGVYRTDCCGGTDAILFSNTRHFESIGNRCWRASEHAFDGTIEQTDLDPYNWFHGGETQNYVMLDDNKVQYCSLGNVTDATSSLGIAGENYSGTNVDINYIWTYKRAARINTKGVYLKCDSTGSIGARLITLTGTILNVQSFNNYWDILTEDNSTVVNGQVVRGAPTVAALSGGGSSTHFPTWSITRAFPSGITTTAINLVSVTTDTVADTFNKINHGLANGTAVYVSGLVNTTGVANNLPYFIVGATMNAFQLAHTSGGTAIALGGSNDSSLTVVTASAGELSSLSAPAVPNETAVLDHVDNPANVWRAMSGHGINDYLTYFAGNWP